MLRFEDNDIYLTRGDTAYIGLNLTDSNGEEFNGTMEDTVILSVKKEINEEKVYAFQVSVPFGVDIKILPEHTKNLEYGRYYYDIQINMANGDIFTVVEKAVFNITQEVTL